MLFLSLSHPTHSPHKGLFPSFSLSFSFNKAHHHNCILQCSNFQILLLRLLYLTTCSTCWKQKVLGLLFIYWIGLVKPPFPWGPLSPLSLSLPFAISWLSRIFRERAGGGGGRPHKLSLPSSPPPLIRVYPDLLFCCMQTYSRYSIYNNTHIVL